MKKFWTFASYVLVALLASVTTLACFAGYPGKDASKLDELADIIEYYFIGETDRTEMEDSAAAAMVASLGDKWSYYIPADDYAAHVETMNNAYVGIGITIQPAADGSGFDVTKVNEGGPAEEAGMEPGDVIIAIEEQSAVGMSTTDARNLVRGKAETQVTITIRRGTEEIELSVTRKEVQTPVAVPSMLDDGIGLISIANFDTRCASETIASIESLLEQGATALIFDVRFNPGGYKDELVRVLDYLLPEGPLFRSEDYRGVVNVDESDSKFLDVPMAVLINGDSYSAAEFFAAALREYDAAIVVGEQTVGKGYFQTTIDLSDGSAVGLSIGKYTTPNGVSLADVGITPDIPVEVDEETAVSIYAGTLEPEEDPQIQAAMEALKSGS